MSGAPQGRFLSDGQRLHLQHGPIDLIVEAFGAVDEVETAYRQAWRRFQTILQEIVDELPLLRRPLGEAYPLSRGAVAQRMVKAVWPHRQRYITPMAAVAGSVADEMMAALTAGRALTKAYVNNGGDIALRLAPGQSLRLGIVANQDMPTLDAFGEINHSDPIRGIATSGWRGRSQSLGIADAATVLARSAAEADAAATMVANAVNVDHPAVTRMPANFLRDDSDLGHLPVTTDVGPLPEAAIGYALKNGKSEATRLRRIGLLESAFLALQGQFETIVDDCEQEETAGRTKAWT